MEKTYAFWYSGDNGRSYGQVSTGMPAEAVLAHMQQVGRNNAGLHTVRLEVYDETTTVYANGSAWRWSLDS